ncbi:MAG: small multi-drug export protein [Spirochaetales bacterium]|nr:small multi-drug export protein [Spirochaetales bacterium]
MTYIITAFLTLLPISELRGAIPYAIANGLSPVLTWFYCVILNATVGPLVYIFLSTFHKILVRYNWYLNLFEKFVEKTRNKVENKVKKYGYLGITLFVAIPLPITGAWTGSIAAFVFKVPRKQAFVMLLVGVMIAGVIVTGATYSGVMTHDALLNLEVTPS